MGEWVGELCWGSVALRCVALCCVALRCVVLDLIGLRCVVLDLIGLGWGMAARVGRLGVLDGYIVSD